MLAFIVSSTSVPVLIWFARRFGVMDKPAQRKVHTEPKPLLGGVAIFLGYTVCFVVIRMYLIPADSQYQPVFLALYACSAFLLGVGIVDDIRNLSAETKLIAQIAAAAVMIYFGVRIRFWIDAEWLQSLLTLCWFVVITNAFNLLDNMDGLSGGVGGLTTFIYFILCVYTQEKEFALPLLAMTFAIAGFLKYNFYPSKIFMGDAGSLMIGFNLAAFSSMITYIGYGPAQHMPIVTPLIIFSVPLYDTASVVWIRIRDGRSIFKADKNHFSHRLVALGMTHRQAVMVILFLTFDVGLMAVLLLKLTGAQGMLVLLHTLIMFLVIALLERTGAIKMRELAGRENPAAGDPPNVENSRPE